MGSELWEETDLEAEPTWPSWPGNDSKLWSFFTASCGDKHKWLSSYCFKRSNTSFVNVDKIICSVERSGLRVMGGYCSRKHLMVRNEGWAHLCVFVSLSCTHGENHSNVWFIYCRNAVYLFYANEHVVSCTFLLLTAHVCPRRRTFQCSNKKKEMWRPHKQPFFLILLIKTLFFISPLSHKLICYLLQHLLDYAYISDLTMATKCSRFMPGLLALVSASFSSDEIRKPAAFPAYPPWVATYKVRITQNTHTQHVTALIKQWDKTQVHSQSDVPENTRPAPVGNWHIIHG